jgi:hypothetical protein
VQDGADKAAKQVRGEYIRQESPMYIAIGFEDLASIRRTRLAVASNGSFAPATPTSATPLLAVFCRLH